jgi:hypothetical protein
MLQKWLAKTPVAVRAFEKKKGFVLIANPVIFKIWVGGNRAGLSQ